MSPDEAECLAYGCMISDGLTPEQAQEKINEIKAQPGFEERQEFQEAIPEEQEESKRD
jgi:hypothetical protein